MNILVVGGTKFFGISMVNDLIQKGHDITIATRGITPNPFGNQVKSIIIDRREESSIKREIGNKYFDIVIDKVAYVPSDVKKLLANIKCDKYIQMSSCAVYFDDHENINENEFIPSDDELEWVDWAYSYGKAKRLSECAARNMLGIEKCVFVRYPVVLGENDYTNRLQFYIEHVMKEQPVYIDNLQHNISYINEKEAGLFISFLAENELSGAVNGCSHGNISIGKLLETIYQKTGKRALISEDGDKAPYNGTKSNRTFSVQKAENAGFRFSNINDWINGLIDYYINKTKSKISD